MISIRGGSGLGDALYVQAIARYLIGQGNRVEACSAWADVFRPLGDKVTVSPFRRERINRLAHYASRRGVVGTTQFEDCCLTAGIREPVELRLDWRPQGPTLLRRASRPIVAVMLPRAPMDRKDGFGAELLPDCAVLQRAVDRLKGRASLVQIGKGAPLYQYRGLDLDLANKTTVSELLDVASEVDGFLGYPSFVIPLAESFDKPALIVWSERGLQSRHLVIRQMTPQKLLHGKRSLWFSDARSDEVLNARANAFLDRVGSPALVV